MMGKRSGRREAWAWLLAVGMLGVAMGWPGPGPVALGHPGHGDYVPGSIEGLDDDEELPTRREPLEDEQVPQAELSPDEIELARSVQMLLEDDLLREDELRELRIFHGQFDQLSEEDRHTPAALLARYELDHPLLVDGDHEQATPLIRGEAAVLRGDCEQALDLLADLDEPRAIFLRGRAYEGLGQFGEAIRTYRPLREQLREDAYDTAEDITAAAEATERLAELEGRPAADYHFIMGRLDRVTQRIDRHYWPAMVVQARMLFDKNNMQEAVETVQEVLRLNPRASEGWDVLGRVSVMTFNFDGLEQVVRELRQIHPEHVLADVLEIEGFLTQRAPDQAREVLDRSIERWPQHRRLLAASVAVASLEYDKDNLDDALARWHAAAGEHPLAYHVAGMYLSRARQYDEGAHMLREALERQPNWTAPRIELGLLLSQDGRDREALRQLTRALELDQFNTRANNTRALLEALAGYQRIETEHFIIVYEEGIDAALAHDMPLYLERIYADITAVFEHEPERRTLIEVLPDRRSFAVRITGMPGIWTVGAATGPVIAITPPREGQHQYGPFDWERVMRHEYTHTVNLSQTDNRVPHWFTEAAAVAQEPEPRDYRTAQLLAHSLHEDELFDLQEINWAFVRPRRPQDRSLAYAQSHWMYEYIQHNFGHETILKMMDLAKAGVPADRVVPEATGESADEFLEGFFAWAAEQVNAWGLSPEPPTEQLARQIEQSDDAAGTVASLLEEHPDHPDLLRMRAEMLLAAGEQAEAREAIDQYAQARPVDPWADQQLAELALAADEKAEAAEHLERLDRMDQERGVYAMRLLQLYRELERPADALRSAHQALHRQPYDPSLREAAATLALQLGEEETALRHLRALTWIEPDRAQHQIRVAAMLARMGRSLEAHEAAERALELNPNAPVERFLLDEDALEEARQAAEPDAVQ